MPALVPKAQLRESTVRAHRLMTNDLKAIAADQTNTCPGGCARTALNIVAECAALNGAVATVLSGGEYQRPSPEAREAHLNSFDTPEKALAYLDQETQHLLAAIETLDQRVLQLVAVPVQAPLSIGWIVIGFPVDQPLARIEEATQ